MYILILYIYIYICFYCIQKGACELKVCSGWFGLREHKVRCEMASVEQQPGESGLRPGGGAAGFVPEDVSKSSFNGDKKGLWEFTGHVFQKAVKYRGCQAAGQQRAG